MIGKFFMAFCFSGFFLVCNAQESFVLYPDKIPNSIPSKNTEIDHNGEAVSKVSIPTLTVFLPEKSKANGAAVIICPGGGYGGLVIKREGYTVAEAFAKAGITAFVLKYRLPDDQIMVDKAIGPLQDAQQAILTVRNNAKKWHLNPQKIGIMGYSAGGHLASTAGTHFAKMLVPGHEGLSVRPDFMILIYPVINFSDTIAHVGSRNNLLGENATPQNILEFSNELRVTKETPPAFLVHASDDKVVPVENSLRFYQALKKYNSPSELHIYPKGDHGFLSTPPFEEWFNRCLLWIDSTVFKK
jgi:acetyl esterase/lipase